MSGEGGAFVLGLVVALTFVFVFSQIAESMCQIRHDVADCEWDGNPFAPVAPK